MAAQSAKRGGDELAHEGREPLSARDQRCGADRPRPRPRGASNQSDKRRGLSLIGMPAVKVVWPVLALVVLGTEHVVPLVALHRLHNAPALVQHPHRELEAVEGARQFPGEEFRGDLRPTACDPTRRTEGGSRAQIWDDTHNQTPKAPPPPPASAQGPSLPPPEGAPRGRTVLCCEGQAPSPVVQPGHPASPALPLARVRASAAPPCPPRVLVRVPTWEGASSGLRLDAGPAACGGP